MSYKSISISRLGKIYKIRSARSNYKLLNEQIGNLFSAPFRKFLGGGNQDNNIEDDFIWALKDVSFEVECGEAIGIIGGNGAGKSTLLKIISRITAPTEGRVNLRGRVGSLLEVGTGFHGELSGRENVYLYGATLGMSKAEIRRKFDDIVQFAQVEKFIDTPIKHYSSGMHTRLAFSVAAHLEPEILLVDEVLAVGDVNFQKKCLGKMEEVASQGRTVLFVSHNMVAVSKFVNRCIWLDHGKVIQIGNTQRVISAYLNSNSDNRGELYFKENLKLFGQLQYMILRDEEGNKTSVIKQNSNICLEIGFVVRETSAGKIDICVMVSVAAGSGVYYFELSDPPDNKKFDLEKGTYKLFLKFPADILNYGHYIVRASLALGLKAHHNNESTGEGIDFEIIHNRDSGDETFKRTRTNDILITTVGVKEYSLEKQG